MSGKSPRWYLDRIRAMDLDETAHRLTEFRMRRRWTALCQKGTDPFAALNSEASLSFGSDKTPDNQTWTTGYDTTEATRILTNHMTQLGVEVNFDGNWLRDPLTGVTSLPQPSFTMKLSDRLTVGDIRQVWELSRMQHLPVLAAAYTATQDEVYADRCATDVCTWLEQNPFLRGPNWTSGIELGLRLTSWVWTRRLLAGWENVAQHFEHNPTFVRVIGQHQLWLETFPSVGSSANNHAVAEAAGQFCAATAFPWFQKSSHWRRESAEFLTTTVAALTFPSGINTELASHYHLFTLELLFAACIEDALSNEPILDSSVADMVVRMADAMAAVIDTTGRLPRQGDSDDAVVLGFDTLAATPLQTLSFVSAAVEPLPWWPSLPGDPRAKYLQGRLQLRAAGARPLTRPSLFIDAGTAVLHGKSPTHAKTWCRFDFGPHGGTSIGAHSHADALSIELRVDGVDVIADAGTFRYSDTKRAYYRGTEAHSTVQIDGKNQSTSGGPFLWTQTAHTTLLSHSVEPTSLDSGTASFTAEHNGYGKVTHRRTITTDVGHSHIEVVDHLIGEEGHNIASRFILGPTIEATIADGTATLRAAQQVIATMTLPPEMTWSVERGDDTGGPWYSAQYGSQTPTNAIVGRAITPIVSARTTINVR